MLPNSIRQPNFNDTYICESSGFIFKDIEQLSIDENFSAMLVLAKNFLWLHALVDVTHHHHHLLLNVHFLHAQLGSDVFPDMSSAAINVFLLEVINFQPLNVGSQCLKERKSHSSR